MTNKENITLLIYTQNFPFGKGETFLENEVPFLAEKFKKIIFIPQTDKIGVEDKSSISYKNEERISRLPENCEVHMLPNDYSGHVGGKDLLKKMSLSSFSTNFIMFFPTLMSAITKDFSFFLKDYREFTFLLFFNYMKGKLLEDYTKSIDGKVLHYSYWMYEWSTILAILKNRRIINFLIARGHGNDIYMENYGKFNVIKNGITKTFGSYAIRFRNFELKNIDYLFPVSIHMEQYLHKKYPEYKHKINKMYLGVPDRGHNPSQMDIFRIATVSNVIPLKRVLRMIQVLKHINIEIEWHHFGSGPLFDTLKQQSEELQIDKNNISVKLHGHVPNNKLIEFYKKNHISVLINLSINEGGAPVSITEALSMGIPAIATDAGGNSETLHDKEYLIKNDFKDKEVAYKIMDIFKMDEKEYMQLRKKSKVHHKKFFGAESNYKEFISNIIFLYKEAR